MTKDIGPPTPLHHEPDMMGKMDRIPTFELIQQRESDAYEADDVPARRIIAHLCKLCGTFYSPTSKTICPARLRQLINR